MNAASQRRLTPILVIVALLLGALWLSLLAGFGRGVRWNAPRAVPSPPPAGRHAGLPTPLPLAEFAPVWQQSLFSPDRKPEAHAANALLRRMGMNPAMPPRWPDHARAKTVGWRALRKLRLVV